MHVQKKRRIFIGLILCLLMLMPFQAYGAQQKVMVIPLENNVEMGLSAYLERNFQIAEEEKADLIIIEMDTPGGRVDAAQDIKRIIYGTQIPTIALVEDQAISAGAYIALACDQIAMTPGSTLGDAEMRIGDERADEKYQSPWRAEFASMAERNGRDPEIAKAFVDRNIAIEGIVEAGELLTLTPQRAYDLGMCDYLVNDLDELLSDLGMSDAEIIDGQITVGERITRFITDPMVAPILLSLGIVCLILEFFTPGIGIFAVMGIILLGLYFGGHMIAGMASWIALLLFLLGLILCAVEIFIPGFGIFGILGIGSIVGSIFLTTPDVATAIKYSAIVIGVAIILLPIVIKVMSKRKFFDKLTVKEQLTTEKGYMARDISLNDRVGAEGIALTVLRPAGTMELEDGTRLDVVTRGDFIEQGARVKVVGIDGTWLIVSELKDKK